MTDTKKAAKRTTAKAKASEVWSDAEREAMKEHAKEQKVAARRGKDHAAGETDLLAKIAEMPEPDRAIAQRIHAVMTANAPTLTPKTWRRWALASGTTTGPCRDAEKKWYHLFTIH